MGRPSGKTTLDAKGRIRLVIGQTMANRDASQNGAGDTTSAGRRPLCSLPVRGSRSVQMRSPASRGCAASVDNFATFVRPPVEGLCKIVVREIGYESG
jgi:hypothetical protein